MIIQYRPYPRHPYIGRKLKRDTHNYRGVLLAPAKTVLNHVRIRLLEMHGVELDDEDLISLERSVTFADLGYHPNIDGCAAHMKVIYDEVRYTKKIPLFDIRQHILPFIMKTTDQVDDIYALFAQLQTKNDYTYRHPIAVSILAVIIGKWLGMKEPQLTQLAIGALLHDIGKVKLPPDLMDSDEPLHPMEYAFRKKHTHFGYQLIRDTVGTSHRQALVALLHHERQDGSGYPFGIRAGKFDYHSQVVAVADTLHHLIADRPHKGASPLYATIAHLHDQAFGKLEPRIIHLVLDKMMQALTQSRVQLSDGRHAKVLTLNPYAKLHPFVQLDQGEFLDLNVVRNLHIERVLIEEGIVVT
ncbi:HD domain-containing protein [Paenibacillus sp. N1-5-1-14]|uniref:HD-GYP domain-containing protein n=1 Tax=Paenibacillus radicibacter TaxID=2972488 RepID=UPI0021598794|nr:HD domain-containing phosphohydrolase [Paenibacillus radicibacter]MCR8642763.1 HD domain-containing protein [Paenibacillus radicibacter]